MRPERENTLVDLLDRLLDRGLILNADVIISVAGIPMIGLNLRAALASMETMLDYGMMEAWDRSIRDWYARQKRGGFPWATETILFKSSGYLCRELGVARSWVPGFWHITNERLFLCNKEAEILFEVPLGDIKSLRPREMTEPWRENKLELELRYNGGYTNVCLSELDGFCHALEKAAARKLLVEWEAIAVKQG